MRTIALVFAVGLAGCLSPPPMGGPDMARSVSPGPGAPDGMTAPTPDGAMPAGPDGGTTPMPDMTPPGACANVSCGLNSHCSAGLCVCDTGFELQGGTCKASAVPDPATHTQVDVCNMYKSSDVKTPGFFSVSSTSCDPGTVTAAGLDASVTRINFHRWLVGLAATSHQTSNDHTAQDCALVSAWNPAGPSAHFPPSTAQCYTADGAAGAGSSNIAWGCGTPVDAIDQWIDDQGNETTLGHRRWILNPPLDPVGFGIYLGGDSGYGSAACLQIFGMSGSGPNPDFVAYPPPGPIPYQLAATTWSFSGNSYDYTAPTVKVVRMSDGMTMPTTLMPLDNPGGFNYANATSWTPGFTPAAGETYRVTVTAGKTTTYDVMPVDCM
jgi:hypothetical protein